MNSTVVDPPWISARHLHAILHHGGERLPGTALAGAGLAADAGAAIPLPVIEQLLADATRAPRDALPGLTLGQALRPAALGVVGHLVETCADLGEVLGMLARYNGLLSNIGHLHWRHAPGEVHVIWDCRAGGPLFRHQATDYVLAALTSIGRQLLPGAPAWPLAVHLRHDCPGGERAARRYQAAFGCRVMFGQPWSGLVLPLALLRQSLPHGDAALRDALRRHADAALAGHQTQPRDLAATVRRLIEARLDRRASQRAHIARQLGLSERSLARQLAQEGHSFKSLLDEARDGRAIELLRNPGLNSADLAERLGFATAQSFFRWFRRRHGRTPGEYRRLHFGNRTDDVS